MMFRSLAMTQPGCHCSKPTLWLPKLFALVISTLAGLAAFSMDMQRVHADQKSRPNIIFIMADDMGYGDAGCYGQQQIQTPNIDRLAAEGMRFRECYAGSAVCAPSRSVLMTGLHSGHTRVRGNFGKTGVVGLGGRPGRVPLRAEDITIAEVLQTANYTTGMVGKWGLGEPETTGTPNRQGFDFFFGHLNQRRAHTYYPTFLWLNEDKFDLPGNANNQRQQYSHDLFSAYALNTIRRFHSKPFFLYLPFTIPHSDFDVPDISRYADRDWTTEEKAYAAMISRLDDHIGQIMALLKELQIDDQTVVFFCSDNGAANRYEGVFDSSGPLRGRKRDLYEGGLRTPMLVRWPGQIPAGTVSDTAWSFTDFFPTAADLAGAKVAHDLDGTSIVPTLLGQAQDLSDRKLYWEFHSNNSLQQAARWKNWKAVRQRQQAAIELYDLETDLAEAVDVSAEHPQIVQDFAAFFRSARTESEDWPTAQP